MLVLRLALAAIGLWLFVPNAIALVLPNFWSSGDAGEKVLTHWDVVRSGLERVLLGALLILPPRVLASRWWAVVGALVVLVAWHWYFSVPHVGDALSVLFVVASLALAIEVHLARRAVRST